MRICHVASGDLWAGAEVQIWTLLGFLRRQPGIELAAVFLNDRELARRAHQLGIEVTVLDETRLDAGTILRRLIRLFRRLRPDVVHTHRYKENVLGTLAAAAAGRPAMVRTVHGLVERYRGWARGKMAAYWWLDRLCMRAARQRVVAVSRAMEAELRRCLPGVAVCHIPNGIDPAPYAADGAPVPRPPLPDAAGEPVLGTAGRLVPVKGIELFLHAVHDLSRQGVAVRGLVVGDGPLRPRLEGLARELGLGERVVFAGHVPDVRPYLAQMDLFVLPSFAEGLPMALLEAMAAGLPVVATDVGGVREVLEPADAGLLVPPGSAGALAAACLALVRDPARRAALGRAAARRVAEAFSIAVTGPRYLALYREAAARAEGGR
ncbi:MAG TPA: glycosyltransferase [Thermodesulfobacteriota bacterium]|nr:glycosyltransferase [Thermodesulfobacteriota bacterium]